MQPLSFEAVGYFEKLELEVVAAGLSYWFSAVPVSAGEVAAVVVAAAARPGPHEAAKKEPSYAGDRCRHPKE